MMVLSSACLRDSNVAVDLSDHVYAECEEISDLGPVNNGPREEKISGIFEILA